MGSLSRKACRLIILLDEISLIKREMAGIAVLPSKGENKKQKKCEIGLDK